jgi:catechol 2,3-dioxygenase-like lactoylglutathione lyase family enzyme
VSILFGGIRQLGMVVRDCEDAMQRWGKMGVGPFFTMRFTVDDFIYRGAPGPAPEVTLCFAHSGPLQIELIQQHNDAPSCWQEFLDTGREGAQHVASWFADHQSFERKKSELVDAGWVLVQTGGSRAADASFAYFESPEPGGMMIELSEALIHTGEAHRQAMEEAARRWDGQVLVAARS